MSFAVLSPAFRGLQFPFRDMYVLTFHLNSFTGNNGRPSHGTELLAFVKLLNSGDRALVFGTTVWIWMLGANRNVI